jgi:secondary thiamine-phosphate synthase enzyme
MDTLSTVSISRHTTLQFTTRQPTEFIDLTDRLERLVAESGVRTGMLVVQTLHTTMAVIVNEHERRLLVDFQSLLERIAPDDGSYLHDAPERMRTLPPTERENGHAHCRALLLPASVTLTIIDGRLRLGRWQRVFLLELDGPQDRQVAALAIGEGRP